MTLAVKICGLNTLETLDVALEAGADMVGFVFFPPSPRHVDFAAAIELGKRAAGRARKVALSVDADDDWLAATVAALQPDLLQLHGRETPERAASVRKKFRIPVIKALPIANRSDLRAMEAYSSVADQLLFDARAPLGATRPGGLGRNFDWRLLEGIDTSVPFILSGGLDPTNVAEALRITRARTVDVSSGVERKPGEKDPDKIRAFIAAARNAAAATIDAASTASAS